MDNLINAVGLSLQSSNWYSALAMALTLPDICGWLEDPSARSQARYVRFFDSYLGATNRATIQGHEVVFLTGDDCYALRCSYLHEGSNEISRQRAQEALQRFVFGTTGSHRIRVGDDVLFLDVHTFCTEMCAAVRTWMAANRNDGGVAERMRDLLVIRTTGGEISPGIYVS